MSHDALCLRLTLIVIGTMCMAGTLWCLHAHAQAPGDVEIDIALDTGPLARSHLPVSVEVPINDQMPEPAVSQLFTGGEPTVYLKDDTSVMPGQVEEIFSADGKLTGLRLSWILESAGPGEQKQYLARITHEEDTLGASRFRFEDVPNKYLDCLFGGRPVYRYVYEFDPNRFSDTYKPFHHVYDFEGTTFITKGPGGGDSHHRGIFIGWSQVKVGENMFDLWSMSDRSYQKHAAFVDRETSAGPVFARRVALIDWMNPKGEPLVRERRETVVYRQPEGRYLFDMLFQLETVAGPIELQGRNLHHAGFHYRSAQEVWLHRNSTRYIIPAGCERIEDSVAGPWCVQSPIVLKKRYAIQLMDCPSNPRPTVLSTRDYGRFGAFFPATLEPGKPLRCQYRVPVSLVNDESDLDVKKFDAAYTDYVQPPLAKVVAVRSTELKPQ